MTVLSWNDMLRRRQPLDRSVRLTIGVFDGLHIGHQNLMRGIVEGAGDAVSLVITFRTSPALLLAPEHFPGFILSYEQKLSRLDSLGVQAVVAIDFSEELSNLTGGDFFNILRENLTIQKIVVGQNFRFGKSRISGTDDLKEMVSNTEIEFKVTEPVFWGSAIVSSSRIRAAIGKAELADARAMLAADYALDLRGIPAEQVGPDVLRIRRDDIPQVIPPDGSYMVRCRGTEGSTTGRLVVQHGALTLSAAPRGGVSTIVFT